MNILRRVAKKYGVYFVLVALTMYGCTEVHTVENPIDVDKIEQVISMTDPVEIILSLRTLTNEEKAYAWKKTITEKSKSIVLNASQSNLINEILQEVGKPSRYDGSVQSKKIIDNLDEKAKILFNKDDYVNLFLLLGNIEKLKAAAHSNSKVSGARLPQYPSCNCATGSWNCWVYIWGVNGTCLWDQGLCYTKGTAPNGCGFAGFGICDGQCGI